MIRALTATTAALPLPALAAAAAGERSASAMPELFSAGYLAQVLGSLLVVFLCLFAVIYLLKRVNRIGTGVGHPLRVLGSASVGHRERVVLVEAGGEQLLLGVAPGSVRMLHVLAEPIAVTENPAVTADFAAVLRAANPLAGRP